MNSWKSTPEKQSPSYLETNMYRKSYKYKKLNKIKLIKLIKIKL